MCVEWVDTMTCVLADGRFGEQSFLDVCMYVSFWLFDQEKVSYPIRG